MFNRTTVTLAGTFLLFLFRILDAQADVVSPFASSVPNTETVAPRAANYSSGSHAISETGAFTYSVPIVVPPGRRGLAPKLALSYSSESPLRGGIAVGWSLRLPHIERDPQRCEHDEICYRSSPWGRLVPSRELGGYRARFDSEFANFSHVFSGIPALRSWWEVRTPDGITRTFGTVPIASDVSDGHPLPRFRQAGAWTIQKEEDAFGNTITYEWLPDESGPYGGERLSRIEYTSNSTAGLGAHARIEFEYAGMEYCLDAFGARVSDVPIGASVGRHFNAPRVEGARRLTAITTHVKDSPTDVHWRKVRTYALSYDAAATSCDQDAAPLRYLEQIDVVAYSRRTCRADSPSSGGEVCDSLTGRYATHEPPLRFSYGPRVPQLGAPQTITDVQPRIHQEAGDGHPTPLFPDPDHLGWGEEWGRWYGTTGRLIDMDGDGVLDQVFVQKVSPSLDLLGNPISSSLLRDQCQLVVTPGSYGGGFDWNRQRIFPLPTAKAPTDYESLSACTLDGQVLGIFKHKTSAPQAPISTILGKAYINYQFLDYNGDGLLDLMATVSQSVFRADRDPDFGKPWNLTPPVSTAMLRTNGNYAACPANSYSTGRTLEVGGETVGECLCEQGFRPSLFRDGCVPVTDVAFPAVPDVPPEPSLGVSFDRPEPESFFGPNGLTFLARVYINTGNGFGSPGSIRYPGTFHPKFVQMPYSLSGAVKNPFDYLYGGQPDSISVEFQRLIDLDGDGTLDLAYPMSRPRGGTELVTPWGGTTACMPDHPDNLSGQPRVSIDGGSRGCPRPWEPWNIALCVRRGQKTSDGTDLEFDRICQWWDLPDLRNSISARTSGAASTGLARWVQAVKLSFRDVNSDGLPDLVAHHKNEGLQVFWNTGDGFSAPRSLGIESPVEEKPLESTQTDRHTYRPGIEITANLGYRNRMLDFDQDGLVDFFIPAHDPNRPIDVVLDSARAQLNLGDGFGAERQLGGPSIVPNSWNAGKKLHKMIAASGSPFHWQVMHDIVDVNGDGLEDVARWRKTPRGGRVGEPLRFGERVDIEFQPLDTSQGPPRKLVAVDNGHGALVTVHYTPTSNRTVVTWTPTSRLPSTRWIVESITVEPKFGQPIMTTEYRYEDPIFKSETGDAKDVYRFLGFRRLVTILPMPSASCAAGSFPCTAGSARTERDYELEGGSLRLVSETAYIGSDKVTERIIHWKTVHALGGSAFTYPETTLSRTYSSPTSFETRRKSEKWGARRVTGTSAPYLYLLDAVIEGSGETPAGFDRRTRIDYQVETSPHYRVLVTERWDEALDRGGTSAETGYERTIYENGLPVQSDIKLDALRSATTKRVFDSVTGNLLRVQKPEQVAAGRDVYTETAYDAHRLFAREVKNELLHRVETDYDVGTGALLRRADSNQSETWKVDGHGRPIEHHASVDDGVGRYAVKLVSTTDYLYAPRPINPDSPGVVRTRSLQDSTRSPVWVTSETGYDGIGRPISQTQLRQAGMPDAVTSYEYDLAGGLAAVRTPDPRHDTGAQVTYAYQRDEIGRLRRFSRPDCGVVDIEYLGLERTLKEGCIEAPESGQTTTLKNDVFGRLVSVSEVDNPSPGVTAVTTYGYDNHDRLIGVTDAEGNTTTFGYDLAGRRISMTRGVRTWSCTYDRNGNIRGILPPIPPRSVPALYRTTLIYDDLDRLTMRTPGTKGLPDARRAELGIGPVHNEYDSGANGVGRLTSVSLPFGWVTYAYDPRGRVLKETRSFSVSYLASASATQSVQTDYNVMGQPTDVAYDDGTKLRVSYDARGLPRAFTWFDQAAAHWKLVADYHPRSVAGPPRHRRTELRAFNQQRDWTYDVLGRVVSDQVKIISTGDVRAQRTYTYGSDDELRRVTGHTHRSVADASYTYDKRHRLLTASGPNGYSQSMSYSKTGNILSARVSDGTAVSYSYGGVDPQAVDKLRSEAADFAVFAYDPAGNMTSRSVGPGTWTFEWDTEDQLREAIDPAGVKEAYYYDHTGERALAIHQTDGVRFWFGASETHYSLSGTQLRRYTHMADGMTPLARVENNTSTELQYTDALNNLMLSADTDGDLTAAFHYGSFGEVVSQEGDANHRRQFNSKEKDAHTGLRYYGARYYDPLMLRWNGADPLHRIRPEAGIKEPDRLNLYTFSLNNPIRYYDPDGRTPPCIGSRCVEGQVAPTVEEAEKAKKGTFVLLSLVFGGWALGGSAGTVATEAGTQFAVKHPYVFNIAAAFASGTAGYSPGPGPAAIPTAARSGVWAKFFSIRGNEIGERLGENLPTGFPTFDKFIGGVATSVKSMDLSAKTYQPIGNVFATGAKYIGDVASFAGSSRMRVPLLLVSTLQINQRALQIAVPAGATFSQSVELGLLKLFGAMQNVTVIVTVVP